MHLLTSIKSAERERARWVFKGRLVLLGNLITKLATGLQVFPTGDDLGLHGDVASLQGVRLVLAHCLRNRDRGYITQKSDVTSAYLQARWPSSSPPHFLRLPAEVWEVMPEELKRRANLLAGGSRKTPVLFRMDACLYGHPVSGHVWVEKCRTFMKGKGWVPEPGCPAVLRRKGCLVCVYVDDVLVSGPKSEVVQFWKELRKEEGGQVKLPHKV